MSCLIDQILIHFKGKRSEHVTALVLMHISVMTVLAADSATMVTGVGYAKTDLNGRPQRFTGSPAIIASGVDMFSVKIFYA